MKRENSLQTRHFLSQADKPQKLQYAGPHTGLCIFASWQWKQPKLLGKNNLLVNGSRATELQPTELESNELDFFLKPAPSFLFALSYIPYSLAKISQTKAANQREYGKLINSRDKIKARSHTLYNQFSIILFTSVSYSYSWQKIQHID